MSVVHTYHETSGAPLKKESDEERLSVRRGSRINNGDEHVIVMIYVLSDQGKQSAQDEDCIHAAAAAGLFCSGP